MKTLLLKLFADFVRVNRQCCRWLERVSPNFFGRPRNYYNDLQALIGEQLETDRHLRILEVGGVDRPLIEKSDAYTYCGLDIDEKPGCYDCYDDFTVQSVEDPIDDQFDLIISLTLLEHVPNNTKSLQSIFDALTEGGETLHYVPGKNHFYSLILRMIGPRLQRTLIRHLRPAAVEVSGYPTFFDKCSPDEMRRTCREIGFADVELIVYYKATDYFAFFVPAFIIVSALENLLEVLDARFFASGFILRAKRA